MWQRKQTLFLALAIALLTAMAFLPLASYQRQGMDTSLFLRPWGVEMSDGATVQDLPLRVPLRWLLLLLGAVLGASIALYRNRPRQLRVLRSAFLLCLGIAVAMLFTHNAVAGYLGSSEAVDGRLLPAFFIPFAVLLLCWLAERGIRKDEELVRSADRLR